MNEQSMEPKSTPSPRFSKFSVAAAVVVLFVVGSYLLKDGPLEAGDAAPLWNLSQATGPENIVSMESLRGKVVILDFWSTTCPPCLMQIPVLQQIQSEFPEVTVVGVAVGGESLAYLQQFAAKRNVQYSLVQDARGVTATAYRVNVLPTLFIVNTDGMIVESHEGFWPRESLHSAIRKVLR